MGSWADARCGQLSHVCLPAPAFLVGSLHSRIQIQCPRTHNANTMHPNRHPPTQLDSVHGCLQETPHIRVLAAPDW